MRLRKPGSITWTLSSAAETLQGLRQQSEQRTSDAETDFAEKDFTIADGLLLCRLNISHHRNLDDLLVNFAVQLLGNSADRYHSKLLRDMTMDVELVLFSETSVDMLSLGRWPRDGRPGLPPVKLLGFSIPWSKLVDPRRAFLTHKNELHISAEICLHFNQP